MGRVGFGNLDPRATLEDRFQDPVSYWKMCLWRRTCGFMGTLPAEENVRSRLRCGLYQLDVSTCHMCRHQSDTVEQSAICCMWQCSLTREGVEKTCRRHCSVAAILAPSTNQQMSSLTYLLTYLLVGPGLVSLTRLFTHISHVTKIFPFCICM